MRGKKAHMCSQRDQIYSLRSSESCQTWHLEASGSQRQSTVGIKKEDIEDCVSTCSANKKNIHRCFFTYNVTVVQSLLFY